MKYTKEMHNELRKRKKDSDPAYVWCLLDEIERLQKEAGWIRYIDGDTSTYPPCSDLYQVIFLNKEDEDAACPDHEYYSENDGWANSFTVLWYRNIPQLPESEG